MTRDVYLNIVGLSGPGMCTLILLACQDRVDVYCFKALLLVAWPCLQAKLHDWHFSKDCIYLGFVVLTADQAQTVGLPQLT